MMNNIVISLMLLAGTTTQANPATSCFGCHGADGISFADNIPNLAGQKYFYLVEQMEQFRDGERKGLVMPSVAKGMSQKDIQAVARYFADLK